MSLSTFGAIMGFAAEMVGRSVEVYRVAVSKAKNPVLRETLQALFAEEEKNHSLMEQTRRENVTEMILEPISGFNRSDYEAEVKMTDRAEDTDLLKGALALEEKEQRFFHDASGKVPLPEVARIFRKVAQKKEKNLAKLKSVGLNLLL